TPINTERITPTNVQASAGSADGGGDRTFFEVVLGTNRRGGMSWFLTRVRVSKSSTTGIRYPIFLSCRAGVRTRTTFASRFPLFPFGRSGGPKPDASRGKPPTLSTSD